MSTGIGLANMDRDTGIGINTAGLGGAFGFGGMAIVDGATSFAIGNGGFGGYVVRNTCATTARRAFAGYSFGGTMATASAIAFRGYTFTARDTLDVAGTGMDVRNYRFAAANATVAVDGASRCAIAVNTAATTNALCATRNRNRLMMRVTGNIGGVGNICRVSGTSNVF